jgi:hypothetical protein
MRPIFVLALITYIAQGHPLPGVTWSAADQGTWPLPGEMGYPLVAGTTKSAIVLIPELGDKEKEAGGDWRLLASTDLYGVAVGGSAEVTLEAADPATGEAFASATTKVTDAAPRAKWAMIFSSEQPGGEAKLAFDGDPKTIWHSRYAGGKVDGPHVIGVEFGKALILTGIRYTPREGFGNGNARDYRLEYRSQGQWHEAAAGTVAKGKETTPM